MSLLLARVLSDTQTCQTGHSFPLCLQCTTQNSHYYEISTVAFSWYNEFQHTYMIHHNLSIPWHITIPLQTLVLLPTTKYPQKHAFDSGCSQMQIWL